MTELEILNVSRPKSSHINVCVQTPPWEGTSCATLPFSLTAPNILASAKPFRRSVGWCLSAPPPPFLNRCAFLQQGWPAGTQQILIPSTWQQMPGMTIHNPGQAVVPDSPMGATVSESQQATGGWRSVASPAATL